MKQDIDDKFRLPNAPAYYTVSGSLNLDVDKFILDQQANDEFSKIVMALEKSAKKEKSQILETPPHLQ